MGSAADSLLALPGTIARSTREPAGRLAAAPMAAEVPGLLKLPELLELPPLPGLLGLAPLPGLLELPELPELPGLLELAPLPGLLELRGPLKLPALLTLEESPLALEPPRSTPPRSGVLGPVTAGLATRAAPTGGAMVRRATPVLGASSLADRAVARPSACPRAAGPAALAPAVPVGMIDWPIGAREYPAGDVADPVAAIDLDCPVPTAAPADAPVLPV